MATSPIELIPGPPPARPDWLKVRLPAGENYTELKGIMQGLKLHTVCEEARCPNIGECWGNRTATFMILGDVCTRACRYCAVTSGKPYELDLSEPFHVAQAVSRMGLQHAVVTSVDRDDLPDLGAGHFAATITQIKLLNPTCAVEVLTPDFQGRETCLKQVVDSQPEIFNHNIETVERVFRRVRPGRSDYRLSLRVLKRVKELDGEVLTKSGLMVGLGESIDEVKATMRDLRDQKVDIVTIGQYLRPTAKHVVIDRYVHPDEFAELKQYGLDLGFSHVESGPLVRSSYHAHEQTVRVRGTSNVERRTGNVEGGQSGRLT
ncbi:MAG TPA: lipoyl synthase [Chloroflexota bacterium]|nr:lipoyl synthase [Chloroflexota bacterium]